MMRTAFWILIAANATALAQDSGQKAGLWEFKVVRQMMDGHDMLEQMAAARHQMEQGNEPHVRFGRWRHNSPHLHQRSDGSP